MEAGKLNVTVHSSTSFTIYWKDDLIKTYICYSVEWREKGHEIVHKSFFEDETNYRTLSISSVYTLHRFSLLLWSIFSFVPLSESIWFFMNNQSLWSLTRGTAWLSTHDQTGRPATWSISTTARAPMGAHSSISLKDVSNRPFTFPMLLCSTFIGIKIKEWDHYCITIHNKPVWRPDIVFPKLLSALPQTSAATMWRWIQ